MAGSLSTGDRFVEIEQDSRDHLPGGGLGSSVGLVLEQIRGLKFPGREAGSLGLVIGEKGGLFVGTWRSCQDAAEELLEPRTRVKRVGP